MKKTIFNSILLIGVFLISTTVNAQVQVKTKRGAQTKKVHVKKRTQHKGSGVTVKTNRNRVVTSRQSSGVTVKTNRNRVVTSRPHHNHVIVKKPNRVRRGYIWIDGYWQWSIFYNRYIWIDARWEPVQRDHHWVAGYWEVTPGGFFWVEGCWVH